ncbi:hypothetical protein TIFTF001_000601 [Ficus carica]|uniref:Uncharacterized protein n=1 Tax=Ficus carica TaxID=3494 RepID=A0AA87ZE50_FICCA|nr:hypothetical protein TIFTF001_000601 [Ficus carica]
MATTESQELGAKMDESISGERQAETSRSGGKKGGWITFPFPIEHSSYSDCQCGHRLQRHIIGAIIADSFLGCFSVISISSCITLLDIAFFTFSGTILFALTVTLDSLRPPTCESGSSLCKSPSMLQFAVLFGGVAMALIGMGGSGSILATKGANQFDKTGLAIFLSGKRFYRHETPQGSPFVGLARVGAASIKKRKVNLSSRSEDYYYGHDMGRIMLWIQHPQGSSGDLTDHEGSLVAKPWKLCTVQQVEDFKNLLRIFPLWSSSMFLGTTIAIQSSLTILQALSMDRHLGLLFKFPAGSTLVLVQITVNISLTLIDRLLFSTWRNLTHRSPTLLQRIGLGHMLNILSMAVSALVESKRLKAVALAQAAADSTNNNIVPMMALWLFPQLILVGIGGAFYFQGQIALYYQEFPVPLRNTATAMASMVVGIAFYLSPALIDLVRRVTGWLPDNINIGRLDNVYWMLVVIGVLNFGYFLVCAKLYRYQHNVDKVGEPVVSNSAPSA